MMRRFFVGNFDFEHHLAHRHFQPSQRLQRLNAELASSWLAVANDGDYLWCPQAIDPEFFANAARSGLPRVVPVADYCQVPAGVELIPWGWTDALMQLARLHRWEFSAPPSQVVICRANARQFSFDLETEWQIGLPGASIIREPSELEEALLRAHTISPRIVIKANWGMSGRERIVIEHSPADADRAWITRRLGSQQPVFVEPWVTRVAEVGIQIEIPQLGTPQLIRLTTLMCDPSGQYQGSWFTDPPDAGENDPADWQPAVEFAMRAAERLRDSGYFGPVGIDAMRYQLPDGSIQLRPLQDINARWTMGRLSLGWRRGLRDGEHGFFWQTPQQDSRLMIATPVESMREVNVAPLRVGEEPNQRVSAVIYVTPQSAAVRENQIGA